MDAASWTLLLSVHLLCSLKSDDCPQVSSYAKHKGLQLVGYYHANERFDDTELVSSARKVADKLYSHNSSACAVLVRLAC